MARPYASPGIGWILAVIVVILCVLQLIGALAVAPVWLILGLALAILL